MDQSCGKMDLRVGKVQLKASRFDAKPYGHFELHGQFLMGNLTDPKKFKLLGMFDVFFSLWMKQLTLLCSLLLFSLSRAQTLSGIPLVTTPLTFSQQTVNSWERRGIPNIVGYANFQQDLNGVTITVNVSGITQATNSFHGIHVHQVPKIAELFYDLKKSRGDVTDLYGNNAGGHFDPLGISHGAQRSTVRVATKETRWAFPRTFSDFSQGNWFVDPLGNVVGNKALDLLALTGPNSIIGRAFILHNLTDTCTGTNGFAGKSRLGNSDPFRQPVGLLRDRNLQLGRKFGGKFAGSHGIGERDRPTCNRDPIRPSLERFGFPRLPELPRSSRPKFTT